MQSKGRACTLVSGSSGNSIYIENADGAILVDAGVRAKILEQSMRLQGINPEKLRGILVTHEHSDHIAGLSVMARRYALPVFMTQKTYQAACPKLDFAERMDIRFIKPSTVFEVGTMAVTGFRTPHDAAEPMGFRVDTGSGIVTVATDIGEWTDLVAENVTHSDLIFIEANYDSFMLWNGPYPWPLKQRIDSAKGHLSNLDCGAALVDLLKRGNSRFVLIHLSKENNRPELAFRDISTQLSLSGAKAGADYRLLISPRNEPGLWQFF